MIKTLELRLGIRAAALAALREHPLLREAAPEPERPRIEDVYFDTPDQRLHDRGGVVCVSDAGGSRRLRIAALTPAFGGLRVRAEWDGPADGARDFSTVEDRALARFLTRHAARLAPLFRARFRRQPYCCTGRGGVPIHLDLDEGSLAADAVSQPLAEVTLSAGTADPADLLEFAAALARDLPLLPMQDSRAEAGYRLLRPQGPVPLRAESSALTGEETLGEAFGSLAQACIRQWAGNAEAALRQGAGADPEFIHQVRVGLRRLRSSLRVFAPALPRAFVTTWRQRLGGQAACLDATRDLDVLQNDLLGPVEDAGLVDLARLRRRVELAREAAGRGPDLAVDGHLILDFGAALLRLTPADPARTGALRAFAARRLRQLRQRARRRFAAAAELAPPALHRLRIGLKDLRYATEFFAPVFPGGRVAASLDQLTRAQSSLGFIQDLEVARTRLATWTDADPTLAHPAGFVLGWHAPRYARMRRRVLRDCTPVLWGKPFWN